MVVSLVEKVTNYNIVFTTALGSPDKLIVDKVHMIERLSTLFEMTVEAHSKENAITFKKLVGKPASLKLTYKDDVERDFAGVVGEVRQGITDDETGFTHYTFKIYPTFWIATFNQDYKIYQNKSASDIIEEVLGENGVDMFTNKGAPKGKAVRKYCVRYGESAYDFCARLMAEEGIFYYFTMSDDGDMLQLSGGVSNLTPIKGSVELKFMPANTSTPWGNTIQELYLEERVVPKKSALADYDFVSPDNKLHPKTTGEGAGGEVYRYPGRFFNLSTGEDLNTLQIEQLEWAKQLSRGRSTAPAMRAGGQFMVTSHPREDANGNYNLYEVEHFIDIRPESTSPYYNRFVCIPDGIEFRPYPIAKPRIHSNQIAIVTGPSGEEIHTDEHGRIKVQFYWDQYGEGDDKSSCWIRVAQLWAGSGWGFVFIPRIGMEVVVSFLEGDPDRPLVVGCVYNGNNKPPYALPDEKTKSTIHTNSSKDASDQFNEIRFEDKKDSEQLYVRAQKDYDREVMKGNRTLIIHEGDDTKTITKGNYLLTHSAKGDDPPTHELHMVKGDRIMNLDKGNETVTLKEGDQSITLKKGDMEVTLKEGDQTITLKKGNRTVELKDGDETYTIKGKRTTKISKEEKHTVEDDFTLDVSDHTIEIKAKTIKITSTGEMTLKGSKVTIESTEKEIKLQPSDKVKITDGNNDTTITPGSSAEIDMGTEGTLKTSSKLEVKSDGQLKLKGSTTAIN